ncbi:MAG: hypothetical protein DWH79_13195 [Planctomycetota bacterium]|nr:MAG: hypothetical protein DWH79_13195 [Planctomycetota bacterium]
MILAFLLALCGAMAGCVAGTLASLLPLPPGPLRLSFLFAPPVAAVACFLAGWHIGARHGVIARGNRMWPDRFDAALGTIFPLVASLSMVVIWGWVMTRSFGTFHEQGSLPLTLVILPWTAILWIVAGPWFLIRNLRLAARIRSIEGDRIDGRVARIGAVISSLLVLAGLGLPALWNL